MGRSIRLLALLQALRRNRNPVTAAALAREFGVSERTIYRDLSELAAQGAPVEGEAGVGYILRPGLFLLPLMLTEMDSARVLLGWCELRKAIRFFRTDRILWAELRDRYPARRADLVRDFQAKLRDEREAQEGS